MVSQAGWLIGITTTCIIIFLCSLGLYSFYKAIKLKIKLLDVASLTIFFIGLAFLGPFCEFMLVLLTGKNLDPPHLIVLLSYTWLGPAIIFAMYLGAELILPKKKLYIVGCYVVLAVIFELFLWFDTINAFTFTLDTPGEDLIDATFNRTHPLFYIVVIYIVSAFIFNGIGFLLKAIQAQGILRKKFGFLSIGFIIFSISSVFETLVTPGIGLVLVRIGMMTYGIMMYFGIREEPEKKEKTRLKKEIKVEGELFRISQYKKEDITEEEVFISKEKKICLVCKGRVLKFEVFLCNCDAFYCHKCARALIELENACWACGAPIDESKPVKPFEKEEVNIEISEKPQKKPKKKK